MAVSLKGRDFISLNDFTWEEIDQFLKTALMIKLRLKAGEPFQPLTGKTLGMVFTKPSTRTRIAFEVAMYQLGGHALFLSAQELQLRRGETIEDTGRVLSRYLDGIMIRTFAHQDVLDLAAAASIPVINGLTDLLHPTQVLADLLTIYEKKGHLIGLKMAYLGDGNNMTHSLLYGAAKTGIHFTAATPKGYEPDSGIVARAKEEASKWGAQIRVTEDPYEAVKDADIIYTDVWASMGQEEEHAKRLKEMQPYQINAELMAKAPGHALFMHCLPAHRGEEVTDEVIDGPQSIVFDQAENRLHAHKAILTLLL